MAAACGTAVPGGARRHPVLGSGRDMQMVRAVVRSQIIAELRKSWHLEMPWPQLGTARALAAIFWQRKMEWHDDE